MPKASVASVTASAPKRHVFKVAAIAGLCSLMIVGGLAVAWQVHASCALRLPNSCLSLEYAYSHVQQAQGLGDRDSMSNKHSMMFVVDRSQPACFWMKDMHFNLDIIWLNDQKQITKLEPNLTPNTYPKSFCSDQPVAYVLEVKAGVATDNHLQIGQQLHF